MAIPKRKIVCFKLKKEAEGLDALPYPGALGQKIFEQISAEAWKMWLAHQTKLINEYRLNLREPSARVFLKDEMEKFFWGEGSQEPPGYMSKD